MSAAVLMEGKGLSEEIRAGVGKEVEALGALGIEVGLALLLVGNNPSSRQYFLAILNACRKAGITPYEHVLPEEASLNEILNAVHSVNSDERASGLLVLMPLPGRINVRRVVNSISPEKDIDGLGAISVGRLAAEESVYQLFRDDLGGESASPGFLPCTPFGVIRLLKRYGVPLKGRDAVVVGKSLSVGKPLSMMLLANEATVTVCHRETKDLASFTGRADIICTAAGKSGLITGDMVKNGAVVVDIGINVLENGGITGDVDFESVSKKASLLTPVPGGVGPVTIAMLLENTVRSAKRSERLKNPLII